MMPPQAPVDRPYLPSVAELSVLAALGAGCGAPEVARPNGAVVDLGAGPAAS
ncbi:hypothetical protein [Streptosporangium roseum]|uniref:Uncharacterized protein n=1 Tax=Streptosporangium roseum (strain ATCC 12428 / DSM 43021 / JCM 3005 / KCTC 9067 / NCIMB 10171 / NRRL 2505 / NI 9100) TaxID=479432 RepID=D2BCG9_STRRD|nr:hypothetical protein [Streptosporangium roseum]ACZ89998.1 hypothetical protein Sros_7311 [Streptosporangium roseum DSM 43021]